ncbi:copper homeostasis protein cutC homolog [Papilio machaon]|uniref:copper homeostasis protein cutC homolog n=1 Tax=Papilio machaon TaxID=76193 RepID=UPI001E66337C|nr:copper homeostasis protein cutC homolog [Papilio machaon]
MLEVCIDSLESAINAIHGGADELEVCSSLPEGGLTPSPGLVKEILKMRPKVNIMIRCRSGSDFCYTTEEMDTMLSDIEYYKTLNINRFVFGALKVTLQVDEENCQKVITAANPIPVTFHRAFDLCINPSFALDRISKLGFTRLLTSGQQMSAGDPKAINLLQKLLSKNEGKIEIMPGAGVNADNAKDFINIGCKIVHSSCKQSKKINIGNNLSMGTSSTQYIYYTDEKIVRRTKEVLFETVGEYKKGT